MLILMTNNSMPLESRFNSPHLTRFSWMVNMASKQSFDASLALSQKKKKKNISEYHIFERVLGT